MIKFPLSFIDLRISGDLSYEDPRSGVDFVITQSAGSTIAIVDPKGVFLRGGSIDYVRTEKDLQEIIDTGLELQMAATCGVNSLGLSVIRSWWGTAAVNAEVFALAQELSTVGDYDRLRDNEVASFIVQYAFALMCSHDKADSFSLHSITNKPTSCVFLHQAMVWYAARAGAVMVE